MSIVKTTSSLGLLIALTACGTTPAAAPPSPVTVSSQGITQSTLPPAASPAVKPQAGTPTPLATDVSKMKLAKAVGKATVPVDVRYEYVGGVSKNGSESLQLAFVPRVEGTALRVEFPRSESVSISETEELHVQKATPSSVHRHNLVVTPLKAETGEIRALVSMDIGGGRYFGIFVIPVGSSAR
jgi:hypothetical protein